MIGFKSITFSSSTLVYSFLLIFYEASVKGLTYCQRGTYEFTPPLGGRDVCELCLPGTFMPLHDHRQRECFNCTTVLNSTLEIVVTDCNRTQDAILNCVEGYYRRKPRNPREDGVCLPCTICQYPYFQARPCQTYEDTACCLGENYDVIRHNGGVPVCRERPWMCRKGFYVESSSLDCVRCPNDTYMSLEFHSMTKCWDCKAPLEAKHSMQLTPCSSTDPPVIGCEEGFFVNQSMGYKKNDIGCSPCTQCNTTDKPYEGRRCNQINDTICCPEPDMIGEDTPDGPKCFTSQKPTLQTTAAPKVKTCGPGHFLPSFPEETSECQPCPPEHYMDEKIHTRHECKNCKDFNVLEFSSKCSISLKGSINNTGGTKDECPSNKCTKYFIPFAVSVTFNILFITVVIIMMLLRLRHRTENPIVLAASPLNATEEEMEHL